MKKLCVFALLLAVVISLTACNGSEEKTVSASSKIKQSDIFTTNGTESEHNITASEMDKLIKDQQKPKDTASSKSTVSQSNTSSAAISSEKDNTSSTVSNSNNDGWTDGWK